MLRMSKQADYGIVLLAHIAREPLQRVHSARDLAGVAGLPLPMAGKILKALARAGLLESRRGAAGGYALARSAERISLAEVVEALEGPIGVTECSPTGLGLCRLEAACPVQAPLQRLSLLVRRSLAGVSLRDLVEPQPALEAR